MLNVEVVFISKFNIHYLTFDIIILNVERIKTLMHAVKRL